VYVLEDLWGDKVDLHEKGFPNKQYARAIQRLADLREKLLGASMMNSASCSRDTRMTNGRHPSSRTVRPSSTASS